MTIDRAAGAISAPPRLRNAFVIGLDRARAKALLPYDVAPVSE